MAGVSSASNQGFSLIEVLLSSSIFVLIVTALVGGVLYGREATVLVGQRQRATFLVEEGVEAARNIRDQNFGQLTDGSHGLAKIGGQWVFSGAHDTTEMFTRQLTVSPVNSTTKQIVATVTWEQSPQRTGNVRLTSFLTDWRRPVSGSWSNPGQQSQVDLSGGQDGLKVQTAGDMAYFLTDSSSRNFNVIDITNPASPTLAGDMNLIENPKNLSLLGSYGHVTSKNNNQDHQVVSLITPSTPALAGFYNLPGPADPPGISATGSRVYLVREANAGHEFFIIDVSSPTEPVLLGSLELGATGNEVVVLGDKAFVASAHDSQELQVIDVSNPATPQLIGSADLPGLADGLTISGYQALVEVGRRGGSRFARQRSVLPPAQAETTDDVVDTGTIVVLGQSDGTVRIFDVTTATAPILRGSFNAGAAVNDLDIGVNLNYAFLATSNGSREFQVIDIFRPSAPTLVGFFDADDVLNGLAYHAEKNRVFAVGNSNTQEFIVLAPQ